MAIQDTFKSLGDPVRREILSILKEGRLSAGEIAANFSLTNATISHHLNQLKKADLICKTQEKNFIFYELNTTVFDDIFLWLGQFQIESNAAQVPRRKPRKGTILNEN